MQAAEDLRRALCAGERGLIRAGRASGQALARTGEGWEAGSAGLARSPKEEQGRVKLDHL